MSQQPPEPKQTQPDQRPSPPASPEAEPVTLQPYELHFYQQAAQDAAAMGQGIQDFLQGIRPMEELIRGFVASNETKLSQAADQAPKKKGINTGMTIKVVGLLLKDRDKLIKALDALVPALVKAQAELSNISAYYAKVNSQLNAPSDEHNAPGNDEKPG